jgi:hypothetical protein
MVQFEPGIWMNSSRGVALAILLILTVGFFIPVFDQDRATVRLTRDLYERTHPGERTYDIEDLGSLLDPAGRRNYAESWSHDL